MIQTFKRRDTIKAIQWTGDNFNNVRTFIHNCHNHQVVLDNVNCLIIVLIKGKAVVARPADWFYNSQRGNLKMITNDKLRRKYTTEEGAK